MVDAGGITSAARRAHGSSWLETLARIGFVVSGVLHLLIGWIAVRLALGQGGGSADQSGALRELASAPGGRFALWLGVVGLGALGLWQLVEAAFGARGDDGTRDAGATAKAAGKGVVYVALAWTTFTYARGGGSGGDQASDVTSGLVTSTAGRFLLAAIGVGVLAVGAYHVWKGATKKFVEDLRTTGGGGVGRGVERLGTAGYVAKGVALGVVGLLFVVAALQADPSQATGLDAALRTLGEQPFGTPLLVAVGLGFAAFGLYSFARARYARM